MRPGQWFIPGQWLIDSVYRAKAPKQRVLRLLQNAHLRNLPKAAGVGGRPQDSDVDCLAIDSVESLLHVE